ncbi:hypothetical protein [Serratia marcescens]|uniref:hypothetical protein n=1 Tax=Serratia marcescens TaxID=615 RepID=UPI0016605E4C|nr:hypothetical protein [Serratia marcescens]
MTLTTERTQFAAQNEMSMEFVNWFFDEKKEGCGNAWFIMAAAMWEGWKGRANREAQPVNGELGKISVGRLPTMNQENYPGLGDWWVQLRIGENHDEILARVYGATPEKAMARARALTAPPAPAVVKLPTEFYSDEGIVVRLEEVMAGLAVVGFQCERKANAKTRCEFPSSEVPEEMTGGIAMSKYKVKKSNYAQWVKGWNACRAAMLNGGKS